MIKAILNGIMSLVTSIINIVLLPINALIEPLFPSELINAISNFTNLLNRISGIISWFTSLLPPIFQSLLSIALTFTITYYGVVWSYSLIIKIYNVIQKIKFW